MSNIFGSNTLEELLNNRYQIQKELGRNTGRYTFLAKDLQNHQLVVVKFLAFNHNFRWEYLKLFEREVEIIKSLSHPAIPEYIESFEVDTPSWRGFAFVQNYIEAQSLQEYLINGRTFSETEVKQLAKTLLLILAYLHSHEPSVIHRDIKPSNILLANSSAHSVGNIYLVDFGSVLTANCQDGTITIVGTYGYMPPEQFGGKVFPASDLYSLGATLIYLITGVEPADLPQKDLRIQFEEFANISSDFRDWLNLMTHSSLKKRFGSAQESLEALESGKIPLPKPALSKIYLTKTADYLKITIPYEHYKALTQSSIQGVNNIKQDYQESRLKKKFAIHSLRDFRLWRYITLDSLLLLLCLPIVIVCFVPVLVILGLFWVKNVFEALFTRTSDYINKDIDNFLKALTPDESMTLNLNIIKDIEFINSLNLILTQHEIALSFTYTSKLKSQEKYTVFQHLRQNISGVVLEKKSYQLIETTDVDGLKTNIHSKVAPSLYLWMGKKRYGLNYKLTTPELYWLAQVISDFLDIPITRD